LNGSEIFDWLFGYRSLRALESSGAENPHRPPPEKSPAPSGNEAVADFKLTSFPSICDEVYTSRTPITISRRGKPLVVICPIPPQDHSDREDIITAMTAWQADAGEDDDDFPDVWEERSSSTENSIFEA
jgi:antitoxin (DNA-binding transcriptional repressor) of toxin-antitoxin stability system